MGRHPSAFGLLWRPATLVSLGAAFYVTHFLRVSWRIGDEGSIVYGAQRVVEGAVPYRDFFEVMGPGAFYWLALWFKLLGTTWLTSRISVLLTAVGSAWAIYYITSRCCSPRFSIFPAALYTVVTIPLWPGANHHFDSNLWALLAIASIVGVPELRRTRGFLAGVLLGLCSTIMPQKGVLVFIGITTSIALNRSSGRRHAAMQILSIGSGLATVGVTVLGAFWVQGAFDELIYANVVWPLTRYHSVNVVPYGYGLKELYLPFWYSILQQLLPSAAVSTVAIFVILPLLLIAGLPAWTAISVVCRLAAPRLAVSSPGAVPWIYVWTGVALWASEFHRSDIMHLIYGSPILLVLVTVSLAQGKSLAATATRRVLVSSLACLAVLLMLIATFANVKVETRRGPVRMFGHDEALQFIQHNVSSGENVFVYPYYPMYYFLANVQNPTRYSILMHNINTEGQFGEVIAALERKQVTYVLWDTFVDGRNLRRWFPGYTHPPEHEQLLERYLERHYSVVAVKNGFRILRRVGHQNNTD